MIRLQDDEEILVVNVERPDEPFLFGAIYPFLNAVRKQRKEKDSYQPRHLLGVTVDEVELALSGHAAASCGVMAPSSFLVKYPDTPLSVIVTVCNGDNAAAQEAAAQAKKDLAKVAASPNSTKADVEAAKKALARATEEAAAATAAELRSKVVPTDPGMMPGDLDKDPFGASTSKLVQLEWSGKSEHHSLTHVVMTAPVSSTFMKKPLSSVVLPFFQALKVHAGQIDSMIFRTEGAPEMVALGAEQVAKALSASTSVWLTEWGVLTRIVIHVVGQQTIEGFEPADRFEGPRECRVFKMGIMGLGYYPDASANVKASGSSATVAVNPVFDMED